MAVCVCSLAGTAACQHCRNNSFATDVRDYVVVTDNTQRSVVVQKVELTDEAIRIIADEVVRRLKED